MDKQAGRRRAYEMGKSPFIPSLGDGNKKLNPKQEQRVMKNEKQKLIDDIVTRAFHTATSKLAATQIVPPEIQAERKRALDILNLCECRRIPGQATALIASELSVAEIEAKIKAMPPHCRGGNVQLM